MPGCERNSEDSTGVLKSDLAPLRFASFDSAQGGEQSRTVGMKGSQDVIPSGRRGDRDLLFFAVYEEVGF